MLNLVGSDQLRTNRRERVECLAGHPLFARFVELPVARGHVVADGIAAHVLVGPLPGNMPSLAADDDHQLGLVVDLLADTRQDDRGAMSDQGGWVFAEKHGLGRHWHAALGGVVAIVQADAHNFLGVGHRCQ